jgi:hypothetical protein
VIATYLTILVVSSLGPDDYDYAAYPFKDIWDCSQMLGLGAELWKENNMMARCVETRIVASVSTPIERPDDLMEAYDGDHNTF